MCEQPDSAFSPEESLSEQEIWAFFAEYKVAGSGKALARPSMESFRHITAASKAADADFLAEKQRKPTLREQRISGPDAFAFEGFLMTEAMRYRWLGAQLSPTTSYDDWVSGVDAVAEWTDERGAPTRLAIDFTSSEQFSTFLKKSEKLHGNVQVKYLRSQVEQEAGEPKELSCSMPIVLLGFDTAIYRLIATRAKQGENLSEHHPLRRCLVEQAAIQVNLQLVLQAQKIFTQPRATKNKLYKQVIEYYRALDQDLSATQTEAFLKTVPSDAMTVLARPKDRQRLEDLARLKPCLDRERALVQSIPLDADWDRAIRASKTHGILAG